MNTEQRIEKFNKENSPFYLVDHGKEYSLCLLLGGTPTAAAEYGQYAFDHYAEVAGRPIEENGWLTYGDGYDWECVFKKAYENDPSFHKVYFDCESSGFFCISGIYNRLVEGPEQERIMQEADRRNKLKSGSNNINETIAAEKNLQDVIELLANLRQNREPLLHCAVFIELRARNQEKLRELQSEISLELTRSKISVDRLTLRQREGFLSVLPVGTNQFGAQFERVLPASSVANLYPFNFSGKADSRGLYIGRDKYGRNVVVGFDRPHLRRAQERRCGGGDRTGRHCELPAPLRKIHCCRVQGSGRLCSG